MNINQILQPLPILTHEHEVDIDGFLYPAVIDYTFDDAYNEYDVKRVQLEVFDGHYADLQPKGFSVIEKLMYQEVFWNE